MPESKSYFCFSEFDLSQPSSDGFVRLLKEGSYYYGNDPLDFPHEVLQNIVKNFKSGKKPEKPTQLAINYNHSMGWAQTAEEGVAAGWIQDVRLSDDGWLEIKPQWTERAKSYISTQEYRYLSAEISFDYRSKHTNKSMGATLLGAALTNIPFIEGQPELTFSERTPEDSMDELKELKDQLDAKVTELSNVTAARDTLTTEKQSLTDQITDLTAKFNEATSKVTALNDQVAALTTAKANADTQIANLSNEIRGKEADEFITKQLSEGRLTPAEKDEWRTAYIGNKELAEKLMALRPVIPLKEIGSDKAGDPIWDFAAEVEAYKAANKGVSTSDASIAVLKNHNGGK